MRKKVLAAVLGATMMVSMCNVAFAAEADTQDHVKMGIQMYNFNVGGDWDAIDSQEAVTDMVNELAEDGYEGLEWCNFQLNGDWLDLDQLKATMDEAGLETCGLHYHYDKDDPEGSAKTAVERCQALGCNKIIFAWSNPGLFGIEADEEGNWTPEQVDQWVDEMNKVSATLKSAAEGTDIQVLYHNHATELLKGTEGKYAMDMIDCDQKEVDVYWASKGLDGKVDTALDYVNSVGDQVYALHVKDGLDGSICTGEMCGWGKGTYDLQKIVDTAKDTKSLEWVIVENDNPSNFGTTGLEDAQQSAEYAAENIDFNYAE